jgi:TetR/AcrR family transcriptional regulator
MRPKNKKPVRPPVRDPERTRARILDAAFAEFAARGFAGARVDAIARRARSNKRMLYHYFTDKEGLFRAVLRHKIAGRQALAERASGDPSENLPLWFAANCNDTGWIRLLGWESLQTGRNRVMDEEQRLEAASRTLERTRQRQARGQLDGRWDPRHLHLAMTSLTMFPVAYAQVARLITGQPLHDPDFQRDYAAFLKEFAAAFRPNTAKSK